MSKTYEKIDAVISLASNSPGAPTGYGQQAEYLVHRLVRHGAKVGAMSNYGLEGTIAEVKVPGGKYTHFPRGLTQYSEDILPDHHAKNRRGHEGKPHAIVTLYDAWVYRNPALDKLPIIAWTPLDHITLPGIVAKFLQKPNVTPVTMAPHGKRQLDAVGIDNVYIPHGIDTKTYTHTETFDGVPTRDVIGIGDEFLIGMVAANKANRYYHRKAYAENLAAVALFMRDHPNARLYIHADASPALGGFDLGNIIQAVGIDPDKVIFPDPVDLRYGYSKKQMAALYSAFDVLLAPSYGEGFGIPTVEAQACSTRAIASSWAASADLVAEDGWLVEGSVFWDDGQAAWWKIPDVSSIVGALKQAYDAPRGPSQVARDFALQFDVDRVWAESWLPFLKGYFSGS
jgi:glycosyltransferase involved in cell wall biosynthesis